MYLVAEFSASCFKFWSSIFSFKDKRQKKCYKLYILTNLSQSLRPPCEVSLLHLTIYIYQRNPAFMHILQQYAKIKSEAGLCRAEKSAKYLVWSPSDYYILLLQTLKNWKQIFHWWQQYLVEDQPVSIWQQLLQNGLQPASSGGSVLGQGVGDRQQCLFHRQELLSGQIKRSPSCFARRLHNYFSCLSCRVVTLLLGFVIENGSLSHCWTLMRKGQERIALLTACLHWYMFYWMTAIS